MKESDILDWVNTPVVQRLEELLALVEEEIPADFVPPVGNAAPPKSSRPPRLEITITQRLRNPGQPIDESEPDLVNHVTICIRPESPRSQAGRERQWAHLCRMRDSLRARIKEIRRQMAAHYFGDLDWGNLITRI